MIFEDSPILYPILMHDTTLRSFQAFTKKFCHAEKTLNFASFISKDSILWQHDFVNGEIRSFLNIADYK